jgi:hypothetical protein
MFLNVAGLCALTIAASAGDNYHASIEVILDKSESMSRTDPNDTRYDALGTFMAIICAELPHVRISEFDDVPQVRLSTDLTPQTLADVQRQIAKPSPAEGQTKIHAAMVAAAARLDKHPGHRVMIILTDGELEADQQSAVADAIAAFRRSEIHVFVIGLDMPPDAKGPLPNMARETDGQFVSIMPGPTMSARAQEAAITVALRIARRNVLRFCDAASDLKVSRTIQQITFVLPPKAVLVTPSGVRVAGDSERPFVRTQKFAQWLVATARAPQPVDDAWAGTWHVIDAASGEPVRAYAFLHSGYQLEVDKQTQDDDHVVQMLCPTADRTPSAPLGLRAFFRIPGKAATAVVAKDLESPLPERVTLHVRTPTHPDAELVVQLIDRGLQEPIAETAVVRRPAEQGFVFRLLTADAKTEILSSAGNDGDTDVVVDHSAKLIGEMEVRDVPPDGRIETLDGHLTITAADGNTATFAIDKATGNAAVFRTQPFTPPGEAKQLSFAAEADVQRVRHDPLGNREVKASSHRRGSFTVIFRVCSGPPQLVGAVSDLSAGLAEGLEVEVRAEVLARGGTAEARRGLLDSAASELRLVAARPDETAPQPVRDLRVTREGMETIRLRGRLGPLGPGPCQLTLLHRGQLLAQRHLEVKAGAWLETELRRFPHGKEAAQPTFSLPSDPHKPVVLCGDRLSVTVRPTVHFPRRFLDVAELSVVEEPLKGDSACQVTRHGNTWSLESSTSAAGSQELRLQLKIPGLGAFRHTVAWEVISPKVELSLRTKQPVHAPPPYTQIPVQAELKIDPDVPALGKEILGDAKLEWTILDEAGSESMKAASDTVQGSGVIDRVITAPPRTGHFRVTVTLTAGDKTLSDTVPLQVGRDWCALWLVGATSDEELAGQELLAKPSGPLGKFAAGDSTRWLAAILPDMPHDFSIGSVKVRLQGREPASAELSEDGSGHFQAAGPVFGGPSKIQGEVHVTCVGPQCEVTIVRPLEMNVPVPRPPIDVVLCLVPATLLIAAAVATASCRRRPPQGLRLCIKQPRGFEDKTYTIAPRRWFRWKTTVGFGADCDVQLDRQLEQYAIDGNASPSKPVLRCHSALFSAALVIETPLQSNGVARTQRVDPQVGVSELQVGESLWVQVDLVPKSVLPRKESLT